MEPGHPRPKAARDMLSSSGIKLSPEIAIWGETYW